MNSWFLSAQFFSRFSILVAAVFHSKYFAQVKTENNKQQASLVKKVIKNRLVFKKFRRSFIFFLNPPNPSFFPRQTFPSLISLQVEISWEIVPVVSYRFSCSSKPGKSITIQFDGALFSSFPDPPLFSLCF